MTRTVTTQTELAAALADESVDEIVIDSPRGVWIEIRASGSATVSAYDSATVSAYDSATVSAYGSATVSAYGSATVSAYDSATVSASGSATVSASGSATVRAYDSATVRASGSATVRAYDSATVRASGSATVRASGSATVSAYDSATVSAYGSATVSASKFVAVHLHSKRVTLLGGVVIDITDLDLAEVKTWLDYTGTQITDGKVTLYKAVNDDWTSPHGTAYEPGTEPAAPDWRDNADCGGGLHFGPTPGHAQAYHDSATRFVEVEVALDTLRPIPGGTAKAKAPSCRVIREVDVHGRPVEQKAQASA